MWGVINFCRGIFEMGRPCRSHENVQMKRAFWSQGKLEITAGPKDIRLCGPVQMWINRMGIYASCLGAVLWCPWCNLRILLLLIQHGGLCVLFLTVFLQFQAPLQVVHARWDNAGLQVSLSLSLSFTLNRPIYAFQKKWTVCLLP